MFSDVSTENPHKTVLPIQWKHIILFIITLVGLHFILFEQPPSDLITGASQGEAGGASPPAATTKKPTPPPPTIEAIGAKQPDIQTSPPNLHSEISELSFERPFDSIPIAEPIAVCIAVKNQALDLREFFVHHYHNMGVRRFYVMDDGSVPPLDRYAYPGIPRSALTFTYQDPEKRSEYMQLIFYYWCTERYRELHTWMAFLDADEYLDTPGSETLAEVLKTFEGNDTVGALGINWRIHTSSGLKTRPESTRKSFTTCTYDDLEHDGSHSSNSHMKPIVKLSRIGPPISPHRFKTLPGSVTVGEHGDLIESAAWRRPITRTRIGVHHYAVKSREEYETKMLRGNGMTDPKDEAFWNDVEYGSPHVNCSEMAFYEP